jgi:DNA-binding IclR family transcriptional regulator
MTQRSGDPPYLDAQALNDVESGVYEAIATLEYSGKPVTTAQVADVTGLDGQTVGTILQALAEHGVLVPSGESEGDEEALGLARRDWSATPHTRSR